MYISNIIQPDDHTLTQRISSNHAKYRLSPCAKAIGALLLVFGSNLAWADVDTVKKTNIQQSVEYKEDIKKLQQVREMWQHRQYLINDLLEVKKKKHQLQSPYQVRMEDLPEEVKQKLKPLEEQEEYLDRQSEQHWHNLQQLEQNIQQDKPHLWNVLQREQHIKYRERELAHVRQQMEQPEQKLQLEKREMELVQDIDSEKNELHKIEEQWKEQEQQQKTGSTPEINPVAEAATDKPAAGAVAKPAAEAVAKPAAGAVAKPAAGAVAKPADGAVAKPAAGAVAKPADGAVAKPAAGAVAKPADGAVAKPAAGAVAKPAAGAVAKPAAGAVAKPAAEAVAKPAAGAVAKPADGAVAKPADGAKPDAKAKTAPSRPQKKAPVLVSKPAPIIGHNPQVGSYIANQIAAQQMFITDDLQHRLGETRYIDPVTGEEKVSSLWLNTSGAKNRFNSGNDQLRTKSNRYAIQLGGTVSEWSSGGDDQGILGITAGLGKSTNHSHSTSSHHQAQGSVDGYNLGLYSIWYADNQTRLGPYIDLLTQYGWFNNQVKAPNVTTAAHYKSYLFTGALETGYKIQLLETADTKLSIQPRAKVLWQRTSGLLHKEPNAILINVEENNTVTTKLGIRTVLEFDIDTLSSAKNLQISPSFEANWIHSRANQGVQLSRAYATPQRVQDKLELASVNVSPQGNNNIADLKLGIEANIDSNLRLWTYLGHQFGGHNYSDTQATVGMNYHF
ncbi:autotransporter outer membrane beta-barrel domain-containing protein [Yersinia kristensenii]|uniref:autotransporter outer membrane beta-barrel domain-containing protein n=1 Tax=Yersinia kristensenii TaxID=28152 RepID=UPI0005E603A1|nr:autotransporter outer membrane beta-barrel domain-containing protein [Yersinia kristensenii]CNG84605.1 type V secretory pathway%2C adhesin AidA [Yersinia kristensenii]